MRQEKWPPLSFCLALWSQVPFVFARSALDRSKAWTDMLKPWRSSRDQRLWPSLQPKIANCLPKNPDKLYIGQPSGMTGMLRANVRYLYKGKRFWFLHRKIFCQFGCHGLFGFWSHSSQTSPPQARRYQSIVPEELHVQMHMHPLSSLACMRQHVSSVPHSWLACT